MDFMVTKPKELINNGNLYSQSQQLELFVEQTKFQT